MISIDFSRYKALTFDCYGTLIDWESGIIDALRPCCDAADGDFTDDQILEQYARIESRIQAGEYKLYKDILGDVFLELTEWMGLTAGQFDKNLLSRSVQFWRPFADTVEALIRLKKRYQLVILSNIDDDLFAGSAAQLELSFDHVITAEQAGSYKPSFNNFRLALDRIDCDTAEVLHVAQSLYHDIKPANELGLSTVWVNRRKGRPGFGATCPASATPGLEVPDLATLARMAAAATG